MVLRGLRPTSKGRKDGKERQGRGRERREGKGWDKGKGEKWEREAEGCVIAIGGMDAPGYTVVLLVCLGRPWMFSFEVKFYPTEPSMLQEDLTRFHCV